MTKAPDDGKSLQTATSPLAERLAAAVEAPQKKGPPPVHLWHPPFSGDMDLQITRSGEWIHEGRPILREGLVRLFASILRKDDDGYMLVTPVERFRIGVEDVPFVAQDIEITGEDEGQTLTFTTNLGDTTTAGPDTPLRVEQDPTTGEPTPYVRVRGELDARIDRKSFYRMMEHGQHAPHQGALWFGLWSGGVFFPVIPSDALAH